MAASRLFDLNTCVHGLQHVGEKLGLIAQTVSWLISDGVSVPSPDISNIQFSVVRRVVFSRTALVFAETHVELPVQRILDPPVAADQRPEPASCRLLAQNEVPHVVVRFAITHRLADRHANLRQTLPAARIGKVFRYVANGVGTVFFSTVAPLECFVAAGPDPDEVVLQMVAKELHNSFVERFLVPFDGQDVVRSPFDDLPGNVGLAPHGVDRDDRYAEFHQPEDFGYGDDLVALLVHRHAADAELLRDGPDADHVQSRLAGGKDL